MIDTSKRVGSTFPDPAKQQPYKYGRRSDGRYASIPYESLSQSEIDALAAQADVAGLNYDVDVGFGKTSIVIDYNYNFANPSFQSEQTEAEEVWECVPGKALKDILDSKNQLVLNATEGELNELKRRKLNNTLQSSAYYSTTSGLSARQSYGDPQTPFTDAGMQLYKLLLDGVEQIEIPTPTLSHSKVVTASYIYPAQFTNVGKIFSTATLISTENVPSTVLFNFPNDADPAPVRIGDFASLSNPAVGIYQVYGYGWLKNSPSVRQVSMRKWNIVQTWDYGLWLINLYGGTRL